MTDRGENLLEWACQGNREAIVFVSSFTFVAHLWDDLIDCDTVVDEDRINRAFWTALIEMPANPFYQRHFHNLQPVLRQIVIDWMDANELERNGYHERTLAFVLRSEINGLVAQVAYLIGGYDWMRTVSIETRRALHTETLNEYLTELEE